MLQRKVFPSVHNGSIFRNVKCSMPINQAAILLITTTVPNWPLY